MGMGKVLAVAAVLSFAPAAAWAQDQQLGARTKAMGGSYTAFEDDPVSIWLNPAGTATQNLSLGIAYQTYTTYPLQKQVSSASGGVATSAKAETSLSDPAFVPSFFGFVFQIGNAELPMALGICYARPFSLDYSFDHARDPAQTTFVPDTDMKESFSRFRASFAMDFRLSKPGEPGFLTHLSAGVGADIGFAHWSIVTDTETQSEDLTAAGGGAGLLLGVYDNMQNLKVNFGVAYQSPVRWHWNLDPRLFPTFDMPQQLNVGVTGYFLDRLPLRTTVDLQWVGWRDTTEAPTFPGQPHFRDALNYSFGMEYRVPVSKDVSLYPRVGYRGFNAPWSNKHNLPSVDDYKLIVSTKGGHQDLATAGLGVSWLSEQGKTRSFDVGADAGGDAFNIAFGFTYEF
jgi:long-subunit fatty acid transport protein